MCYMCNKGISSEDKGKDSVIIFDGKDPNRAAKWLELSQAAERFAEIWLGVSHGRAFCVVAIVLFPPYLSVSKSYPGSYLLLYL